MATPPPPPPPPCAPARASRSWSRGGGGTDPREARARRPRIPTGRGEEIGSEDYSSGVEFNEGIDEIMGIRAGGGVPPRPLETQLLDRSLSTAAPAPSISHTGHGPRFGGRRRCGDDDDDDAGAGEQGGGDGDHVTASEIAHTCSARRIRISLRVADPPAAGRLPPLHPPPRRRRPTWPNAYDLRHAEVVAAHHGSILFRTLVPFADSDFVAPGHFPVDYFVYTTDTAAASPPLLTRLPPCFIDGFSDPVEDEYYKPYQLQRRQIMLDENIGFLSYSSNDGDEFMVVDIRNYHCDSLELCIFNHHANSPSSSLSPEQWRIQHLEMHHASARKIGRSKK
uniref:DUF1618 domain-containing protein n=1 Tax=Oryza barthii TaxID=65489 RepID=A0A0D3HFR0_9ORYZ